jgi:hypothetical protein
MTTNTRGRQTSVRWAAIVFLTALSGRVSPAVAVLPPGEQLMPSTSAFFLTCRNVRELDAASDKTLIGKLFDDPLMKPFIDDMDKQIEANRADDDLRLGIQWNDVRDVCDGQATMAVVPLPPAADGSAKTGTVAVLDVTNHGPQVTALQQKIAAEMAQRNAQARPFTTSSGAVGKHYVVPPKEAGKPTRELVEVVQSVGTELVWLLGDETTLPTAVSSVLAGANGQPPLASVPTFSKLMKDSTPPAGEPAPHLAFYVDPLTFAEASRAYEFPPQKQKPDTLVVLREAGFDALKAVGGQATVSVGQYGVLARVGVAAPQPWQKSMNMLSFLAGADFAPPKFVGDDVSSYGCSYHDILKAFDHFGPIFDGFLEDEGIWADVLDSMINDPDGPQIDIRKDFVSLLGRQVSGIVERDPINPMQGSRYLLAVETANVAGVADALRRAFANDPSVERMKVGDLDVYKIIATEEVPPNAPNQEGVKDGVREVVSGMVTAVNGYLFIGSNLEILQKVVGPAPKSLLGNAPDYVAVTAELKKFLPPEKPELVGVGFTRLDRMIHDDYDTFRAGKMVESESGLAQILDRLYLGEEKAGPREKKFDGSKLPPFEQIEKFLPPTGVTMRATPDGWTFLLVTYEGVVPGAGPGAAAKP